MASRSRLVCSCALALPPRGKRLTLPWGAARAGTVAATAGTKRIARPEIANASKRPSVSVSITESERERLAPRGVCTKRLRVPVSTRRVLASARSRSTGDFGNCVAVGACRSPKVWIFTNSYPPISIFRGTVVAAQLQSSLGSLKYERKSSTQLLRWRRP
jgi:hypothetical protein